MIHFAKKIFPLFMIVILTHSIASNAQDTNSSEQRVSLKLLPQAHTLNFLSTYYQQKTSLINEANQSGKSVTRKRETSEYSEFLTDHQQKSQSANSIRLKLKSTYLKKELSENLKKLNNKVAASITKPIHIELSFDSQGRLAEPFALTHISTYGLPLQFPKNLVQVGDTWEAFLDFEDKGIPSLRLKKVYTLKKLTTLNQRQIAEIEYSFETKLKATEISKDPLLQQKIANLRRNNISSVSYVGKGSFAFDFTNGHIITHNLIFTQRVSRNMILKQKRVAQEIATIHEFAEALIP